MDLTTTLFVAFMLAVIAFCYFQDYRERMRHGEGLRGGEKCPFS